MDRVQKSGGAKIDATRVPEGRDRFFGERQRPSSDGSGPGSGSEASLARGVVVDVHALESDVALVDSLAPEELAAVLERCAVERERLAVVEHLVHVRLRRELSAVTRANEPLLTAQEAGRRLRMSADWVRDHGERLGITVHLDGVVRYDPAAVARLRHARRHDEPPRD